MKRTHIPKPTAEMKEAAQIVVACQAQVNTIRPKIDAIHNEILAEFRPTDEEGNPVNWESLYILGEEGYGPRRLLPAAGCREQPTQGK
jgi:hypothetical protein